MTERPFFEPNVRKCPRHKAWIQVSRPQFIRYCPRCDIEYATALNKQRQETGAPEPSNLKIMKL